MTLQLDHIWAGYGGTTVLRDVSLTVPDGRVVALVGPNGAGKTTLLSVVSGLISPTSGRVILDGHDVVGATPNELVHRGMTYVTERDAVFASLTVAENLRLFAARRDEKAALERATSAFPKLGSRLNQIAGTMSGGEQRMLALARTYARGSSLVMLDEMSMGLAPIIVDEIFTFLGELARSGVALLLVEQYVSRALALADLVYLLVHGEIVFAGEPGELENRDLLASYLGETPSSPT
jgi:branched-chain amino acid transport system ATP-binding protein